MLGFRFWDIGIDNNKEPVLVSASSSYIWESKIVGEKLDYLAQVDQKANAYFNQDINSWVSWDFDESNYCDDFIVPEIGFWAFKSFEETVLESHDYGIPSVIGVVNGFGKVALHHDGWRSEYCEIIGFLKHMSCVHHRDKEANLHVFKEFNYAYCNDQEHQDYLINTKNKPIVQFEQNYFFKQLSKKYDAELLRYEQIKGMDKK